jgi:hypothetical protein
MALVRSASPVLRTVKVDLVQSCIAGDLPGVRRALCSGSDPNAKVRGQAPLMYAAESGHAAVCSLLIENGARVNNVDSYNRTALHFAVKNLHVETAALLMAAGADRDVCCTLGGESPADIVHMRGSIELVRAVMYFDKNQTSPKTQQAITSPLRVLAPPSPASNSSAKGNTQAAPARDHQSAEDTPQSTAASIARKPPAPERDDSQRRQTPPRRAH